MISHAVKGKSAECEEYEIVRFWYLENHCVLKTRMHSSGMHIARTLTRGVSLPGGSAHVTYPIMHLLLPVCCLHTNWDTSTVHLFIYCCLFMWPARHAGIPPPREQTDTCKNITFANYVRAVKIKPWITTCRVIHFITTSSRLAGFGVCSFEYYLGPSSATSTKGLKKYWKVVWKPLLIHIGTFTF